MAQIIKKTNVLITTLLKSRNDLDELLNVVRTWRMNGINGSGIVPIAILPLEAKLEKTITDIDAMIKIAAKV